MSRINECRLELGISSVEDPPTLCLIFLWHFLMHHQAELDVAFLVLPIIIDDQQLLACFHLITILTDDLHHQRDLDLGDGLH